MKYSLSNVPYSNGAIVYIIHNDILVGSPEYGKIRIKIMMILSEKIPLNDHRSPLTGYRAD